MGHEPVRAKPGHRLFAAGKLRVSIGLRNARGLLAGVSLLPTGKVLEIRFKDHGFGAWVGSKEVGRLDADLSHRAVKPTHQEMGIADALFDVAESAFERSSHSKTKKLRLFVDTYDTAAFLRHRGYAIEEASGPVAGLSRLNRMDVIQSLASGARQANRRLPQSVFMTKEVKRNRFGNPRAWHRIRVLGADGKSKWFVLPVQGK
ncbi:MAG: hypothetical protein Q7R47_02845 [Candidatus Diapherotrites archaeon]|nr:hypothetical protein [Candidatus Diapherotrites archaeon]